MKDKLQSKLSQYDILISYARKDSDWVIKNLVSPLQQCRKVADGRQPEIFFDAGGDEIGFGWRDVFEEAMGKSATIILVYSLPYFDSAVCRFERTLAGRS